MIEKFNSLIGVTESYKAPARLLEILYDKTRREQLFRDYLIMFGTDVGFDGFHEYFQDEHADRKNTKQDFTPQSVAHLVSELVGGGQTHYEPCAGTGGMTIEAWDANRRKHSPFDYRPSWYMYHCEELSERAIPFLLFNVMLRGMNAVVVHCDVLTRKAHGAFFVQNDADDHLAFSSLNRLPYTELTAQQLAVKWDTELYDEIIESREDFENLSAFSADNEFGKVSDFTKAVYAMVVG